MGIVYVLGAGVSKTCGIAVDKDMLADLNPMLKRTKDKTGVVSTYIDAFSTQNFPGRDLVGFENFMSTISALKFMPEFAGLDRNVFAEGEKEIRRALRRYLRDKQKNVQWNTEENKALLDFTKQINWQQDTVLTFNYDLLLEQAAQHLQIDTCGKILHLHGAVDEKTLAWPTYKKFAYRNTRTKLGSRWNKAFQVLRDKSHLEHLIFIGYSMPPTDMEAKGLFNYTDWYNHDDSVYAKQGRLLSKTPTDRHYSYKITVVNPCPNDVKRNYSFFRKDIHYCAQTLAQWVTAPR